MNPRILTNTIRIHQPHSTQLIPHFQFPSLSRETPKPQNFPHSKSPQNPKAPSFASIKSYCAASSVPFGGWDDLGLDNDSVHSADLVRLRKFLVSIGIDDKKHVFMFVLGVVCALAVSRVRISSFIVFPASVLVFGIGFSIGFFKGGGIGSDWSGDKKKVKEEISRVYGEKLKEVLEFFGEFDGRVNDLKNDMRKGIDCDSVTLSDLDNYIKEMESIGSLVQDTRETVKASVVDMGVLAESDQRRNKKKKENGEAGTGSQFLKFVGGLFGENSGSMKDKYVEENVKEEIVEGGVSGERVSSPARGEENVSHSIRGGQGDFIDFDSFQDIQNKQAHHQEGYRRTNRVLRNRSKSLNDFDESSTQRFSDKKRFSYIDSRLQFVNSRQAYLKKSHDYEQRTWESHGESADLVDFSVSMEHVETESSFVKEQMHRSSREIYGSSEDGNLIDDETYQSQMREGKMKPGEDFFSNSPDPEAKEAIDLSFSTAVSNDVLFNRYLTEANDFLKEAKELVRSTRKEEYAEAILYKSAKLLSQAIAMKPMSLLAVGQLGNTYLLHGELKLKISRDLRSLLSTKDSFYIKQRRVLTSLDYSGSRKDEIASILVDVCEECEELLVQAGRKYRLALSIDANDIRALYNWGLALSYRAQLIADIGPEAAFDADKVFLAAIDKFDAMMSKGNVYAPDALLRWGMTLQQRSRLRPSNSKEKMKLLQQAKRLYEDALHMDSDNPRVRDALSSCVFELNYRKL